ncbi:unnamed protein product [Didymodactylos carnosus]|uniref:mRNA capping enzyme adenylation domain-containing protein n=1 Tax=Didymodactylos carnosus TaxID=1234261 RepID=A0A814MMJ3_9BILA|nr:unnamed protein product [Didymodactylos carnosus]CAF3846123.1 unnamed protein product [Didymodactylos carnosus]
MHSSGYKVESNDQCTTRGYNKRSYSNDASDQSAKRFCEALQSASAPQFFVRLREVRTVYEPPLLAIQQKYRRLCGWHRRGFPGSHPVCMHRENYEMILQSSYMVTWKSVGKRYMMLIEEKDKVYMLDQGDNVFAIDHIQFPCNAEYTSHLKDTLVDGELVIDNVDGSDKLRCNRNPIKVSLPKFYENLVDRANSTQESTDTVLSQCLTQLSDPARLRLSPLDHVKRTIQHHRKRNDLPHIPNDIDFFSVPAIPVHKMK